MKQKSEWIRGKWMQEWNRDGVNLMKKTKDLITETKAWWRKRTHGKEMQEWNKDDISLMKKTKDLMRETNAWWTKRTRGKRMQEWNKEENERSEKLKAYLGNGGEFRLLGHFLGHFLVILGYFAEELVFLQGWNAYLSSKLNWFG